MNRRTFLAASGGALGLATVGYYRDRIPYQLCDDYGPEDVEVKDARLAGDAEIEVSLVNLTDSPLRVSLSVMFEDRGDVLDEASWPPEGNIALEPGEEKSVRDDAGSSVVWDADNVEVKPDAVRHEDTIRP